MTIKFQPFPKIPRYRRELTLTEKIDGSNSAVVWAQPEVGDTQADLDCVLDRRELRDQHGEFLGIYCLLAQSRSRFITPGKNTDNFGFAGWVQAHADELALLGPGVHDGEWWGQGIQRGYDLTEKRFSLFNVGRWGTDRQTPPTCCHVVPVLSHCQPSEIQHSLDTLRIFGSLAAPGYMNPEGVVVYHSQSKQRYKILLEGDDIPKGQQQ